MLMSNYLINGAITNALNIPSISAEDAVAYSAKIFQDQLNMFVNFEEPQEIPTREQPAEYQKVIDESERPEVDESPNGKGTIETYTIANGREGPQMGIVIGRLNKNNNRFIAIATDDKTLSTMMEEECLNRDCSVSKNSDGWSIFSLG